MRSHPIVTKQDWIEHRRALLAEEKELTRLRDRLAKDRRHSRGSKSRSPMSSMPRRG